MPQTSEPPIILKRLWNVLFTAFYPVLVVFSLIFTGILLLFSNLSRLAFAIIKLFSKKNSQEVIRGNRKKASHSHHHHH
jgi:hypothetical protein